MFLRFILILATALLLAAGDARAQVFRSERVELELVSAAAAAAPGSTVHVALRAKMAPGWHTYWRNAGDAGLPAEFAWTLPPGWRAGEVAWPLPGRMPEGPLMTYGWEGEVLLPVPVQVPADARPGSIARLAARVTALVCKDICVPETADLAVAVPVGEARADPRWGPAVQRTLAAVPGPAPFRTAAVLGDGKLKLGAWGGPLAGATADGAYFYPYEPGVIRHAAPQRIERGPGGLMMILEAGPGLAGGLKGPVRGVLATRAGAWEVTAAPGRIADEAGGLGPAAPAALGVKAKAAPPPEAPAVGGLGLPLALLLALAGGLLLNLMPCVFPVLAIKAAALARHAHSPAESRSDGLAFTAGVLSTFVGLALLLLMAKAAGEAVGWGFQLQSPWTVATLALVMLAVGLNLSGVFHVGLSLQGAGSLNRYSGTLGAFLAGALAVVVAAPCFAPFMTEAVGYGLTHSALEALLVFVVLGLGFALPFLALSFSPALARRLPRPGPWMDTLKRLLAFPMFGAAAWLAWVFAQQTGADALGLLLAAAVLLALAFHLLGRVQAAQALGKPAVAALLAAGGCVVLASFIAARAADAPPAAAAEAPQGVGGISAEPWSPERLAALRAEGRPVLVNFTAAWCVTCKVNEANALGGRRVAEAFKANGAAYLVADWTRRDEAIARELARHGRSGVPLYLVYRPDEDAPVILPQLLTETAVVRALDGE